MITLHRNGDRAFCDAVEERLRDLVVAHRVEPGTDAAPHDEPCITEGTRTYQGSVEITSFLDEVEEEVGFSRQISADACYIDPDDPTRCI